MYISCMCCLIEVAYDRGNHYVFTSLIRELDAPGELAHEKAYPFEFANVEKQYETFNGINVRLRSVMLYCLSWVSCVNILYHSPIFLVTKSTKAATARKHVKPQHFLKRYAMPHPFCRRFQLIS